MDAMHTTAVNKFGKKTAKKQKLSYVKQLHLNSFNIPLLVSVYTAKVMI